MAGIITNVDSDIQKLSVLKKKIDDVKKALKGIDIKVDIDIAKDLEAQLKSLTGQYDALASKIAETEKKIAVSTKNINDTTEKIIKAQEAMIKAANTESGAGQGQSSTVSNVQIATVQAQAAAYEDLRDEIDKVLGSRAENIKRLIDEEAHIKSLKREIADLSDKQSKVGLSKRETQRLKDLNNSLIESKISVSQLNQVLKNDAKLGQTAAGSMSRLSQELGRMRMAYRELTDEEKAAPFGQTLKASIEEADKRIKELDASIGNHQRNVGNYANSWNGLSFSIQQLAREMPSLAYGPTVFFSAISNNLPMLADEIKRAREEYQRMVAAGQKGTPVWKQVAKSIVSWQTLLVAGITILTMHGDKIIEWVGSLFKGRDVALNMEDAIKKVNNALDFKDLGTDVANFQRLVNLYRDLGDNAEEKKKFIEKYKEELEKTGVAVNSVAEADKLLIEKADDYKDAMEKRARATAALKMASEEYAKAYKKQVENAEKIKKLEAQLKDAQEAGRVKDATYTIYDADGKSTTETILGTESIQKEINRLRGQIEEAAAQSYIDLYGNFIEDSEKKIKEAGFTTTQEAQAAEAARKAAEAAAKARKEEIAKAEGIVLSQMLANQDSELSLMSEGADKKIKQIELEYDRQIEAIEKKEAEVAAAQSGKLTDEQKAVFASAKNLEKQKRDMGIAAVMNEETESLQKLYKDYQSLIDKYIETERKFNQDRAKLVASGASNETIAELDYQQKESLDSISLELAKRQETFKAWMDTITEMSLEELRRALVLAKKDLELLEKQNPLSKKTIEAKGRVSYLEQQLQSAKSGKSAGKNINEADKDWKELYQTLREVEGQFKEIGDAIGGTVGKIIGAAGEIAGSTLSMLNGIRTLTDGSIEAIKGASDAATKALQSVERASVILSIIGAAFKIMTKISELAKGSGYEKMKSEYEDLISAWDKLIDRKLEYLNLSYGTEAKRVEEQTLEIIQKQIDAYKELAEERMNVRKTKTQKLGDWMFKTLSKEAKKELEDVGYGSLLGVRKSSELLNLTADELRNLRDNATQFWIELDDEVRKYLEGIIDGYDQIAEVENKLQEKLTDISFDSLYDSFIDTLMDMEASTEDFAENLSEMLTKALISDIIGSKYKERLKKWYESWAASMDDGQTAEEIAELKREYQEIVSNAIEERNAIADMTGYGSLATTEQKATYGGFEAMSEDTGTELNGRFTALQMAGEEIKREAISQTVALNEIRGSLKDYLEANGSSEIKTSIDNILTFVSQSYMELQQINENTAANVKELKSVSSFIRKWDNKIMSL